MKDMLTPRYSAASRLVIKFDFIRAQNVRIRLSCKMQLNYAKCPPAVSPYPLAVSYLIPCASSFASIPHL